MTQVRPRDLSSLRAAIAGGGLPVGALRSYGDVCLNSGGALISTSALDRFIDFDTERGVIRCEAGVRMRNLIAITLRHGWFPPVLPGTAEVTVGGAIANDVHGKNHQRAGSFGCHLRQIALLRPGDEHAVHCGPEQRQELFAATVAGLGQTGFILNADIQLKRVPGPWLEVEREAFHDFSEFIALTDAADRSHEYTVAWLDCLDPKRIQGVFFRANHSQERGPAKDWHTWPALPLTPPFSLINRPSMWLFNHAYHWQQTRGSGLVRQHWQPFFFPLDAVPEWNRVYGPRGFRQLQCVLPLTDGATVINELLSQIARYRSGSFLSVLKRFGEVASPGMLSFPRPGLTLALDLPHHSRIKQLMQTLHRVVHDAGGRIYAAKDADLSQQHFQAAYPDWASWQAHTHPELRSDFVRRVLSP